MFVFVEKQFQKPLFENRCGIRAKPELLNVLININSNWVNFSDAQNDRFHIGKAPAKKSVSN